VAECPDGNEADCGVCTSDVIAGSASAGRVLSTSSFSTLTSPAAIPTPVAASTATRGKSRLRAPS
jgi:hypothetical protein